MKRKTAVFLLVLLAVSAAVYGLDCGRFRVDDDRLIVQKSAFFEDPGNILRILSTYDDILTERSTPYYRPLTNLCTWRTGTSGVAPLRYTGEPASPRGVAALVWLLIAGAFGDGTLAFFCALLFAVHPVAAEAVNFVSARNNLLCAAWMAGACCSSARERRRATGLAGGLLPRPHEQGAGGGAPLFPAVPGAPLGGGEATAGKGALAGSSR